MADRALRNVVIVAVDMAWNVSARCCPKMERLVTRTSLMRLVKHLIMPLVCERNMYRKSNRQKTSFVRRDVS